MPNTGGRKKREDEAGRGASDVCIEIAPGICGFNCVVRACRKTPKKIGFQIAECECGQIKKLSENLQEMDWKELFTPVTRNPVYLQAQKTGCHPSCVIPAAMLKAAEVVMEMALPKNVHVKFIPCEGDRSDAPKNSHTV